jgi:hypothetical protein
MEFTPQIQGIINAGDATPATVHAPHVADITRGIVFSENFVTTSALAETVSNAIQRERETLNERHSTHCRGLRVMMEGIMREEVDCGLCISTVQEFFRCDGCHQPLCVGCFPQAMQDRISESDGMISYACPYCRQTFRSFHATTPRESLA